MGKKGLKKSRRWVARSLYLWADHWKRTAEMVQMQTASQLYDRILEGRIAKSGRDHMKLPTKRRNISPMIPNIPIMDDWLRHIQMAIQELPETQQKAIFEQFFGDLWGRVEPDQWSEALGISKSAFRKRISRAYKFVDRYMFLNANIVLTGRHKIA